MYSSCCSSPATSCCAAGGHRARLWPAAASRAATYTAPAQICMKIGFILVCLIGRSMSINKSSLPLCGVLYCSTHQTLQYTAHHAVHSRRCSTQQMLIQGTALNKPCQASCSSMPTCSPTAACAFAAVAAANSAAVLAASDCEVTSRRRVSSRATSAARPDSWPSSSPLLASKLATRCRGRG